MGVLTALFDDCNYDLVSPGDEGGGIVVGGDSHALEGRREDEEEEEEEEADPEGALTRPEVLRRWWWWGCWSSSRCRDDGAPSVRIAPRSPLTQCRAKAVFAEDSVARIRSTGSFTARPAKSQQTGLVTTTTTTAVAD